MFARATDGGRPPKSTTVGVTVSVVEPALKAPTWIGPERIHVKEMYNTFQTPIANFTVTA
jgi:hypothetical protein